MGLQADAHAATDDVQVETHQQDETDETKLLAEYRKDEIGMALGQEFQLGLGAIEPALAKQTTGADGNLGLDDVVTGPQRIGLRIQKGQHPLSLVVVHQEEPEYGQKTGQCQPGRQDQVPVDAGQEDDE